MVRKPHAPPTEQEKAKVRATQEYFDDVQRQRNQLVELAQDGDEDDRRFAIDALKKLNDTEGYVEIVRGGARGGIRPDAKTVVNYDDSAGNYGERYEPRGYLTEQGDDDPNPSGPLYGGFVPAADGDTGGSVGETPSLMRRLDTSLGQMALNAPKRRQALVEYDKGVTGGLGTKAAQKVEEFVGDAIPFLEPHSMSPEALARYAQEAPLSDMEKAGLQIAGTLNPGSTSNLVAKGGEKLLTKAPIVQKAIGRAPTIGSAAAAVPVAAAASAAHEGSRALVDTGSWLEAGKRAWEAATDLPTVGLAALFGGAFGKAKAMRERNPDVRRIEDAGGRVGPLTPGSGKPFEDPLVAQGIDEAGKVTEAGIGKTSRASARGFGEEVAKQEAAASGRYGAAKKILQESGEAADVTDLYDQAYAMTRDPSLPREVRKRIENEIIEDMFSNFGDVADDGNGGMRVTMSANDANKTKRKLQYFADYTPSGAKDPHFEDLSGTAKGAVDQTGWGKANAQFKADADKIKRARGAYGLQQEFGAPIDLSQEEALATRLMREGQDTRTAGKYMTPEQEQALKDFPGLRRYVEAPGLLQSRANLEFGLDKVGGLSALLKPSKLANFDPAKVRLISPLLQQGIRGVPASGAFFNRLREAAAAEDARRKARRQEEDFE